MRAKFIVSAVSGVAVLAVTLVAQQAGQTPPAPGQAQAGQEVPDDVRTLVTRLELEKFKATLKGLTQFGDRREGTERNREAVDWIEAQLKSFGCPTGRINYEPPAPRGGGGRWWRASRACRGTSGCWCRGRRCGGRWCGGRGCGRSDRARRSAGRRGARPAGGGGAGTASRRCRRRWRRTAWPDARTVGPTRSQQFRRLDALRRSRAHGREQQPRGAAG